MGIQGLTTFVASYDTKYGERVYVRKSLLVVDGNNVMYHLLGGSPARNGHLVGGDYVAYAHRARDFCQKLKEAEIRPIVLFDGAYETAKWSTVLNRHRKSIKENARSNKEPGNSYLPVAVPVIFREILTEQRVLHYQTEFEADETLGFLAKRLGCPVLSSDSDFFLYPDLVSIPLASMEFRKVTVKGEGTKALALTAKTVSLQRLCREEFKFSDKRLLPLAALVLGNDTIPNTTFANFHKGKTDDKYDRVTFIFKWAGRHKNWTDLRKNMLMSVRETDRVKVALALDSALKTYAGEKGEERIWLAVAQQLNLALEAMPSSSEDLDVGSKKRVLPDWFLLAHLTSALPTYLLQLATNRTLLLPPQVEMTSLPSTHSLAIKIIQVTAAILLGPATFILISRNKAAQLHSSTDTLTHLPNFGSVPTIEETGFRNRAQAIIYALFDLRREEVEFLAEWPLPLKFVLISAFYFLKKVQRPSAPFIAVAVILALLKPIFTSNGFSSTGESVKSQGLSRALSSFYTRFSAVQRFSKSNPYEMRTAYEYSLLQSILFHGLMLSKLLGNPFRSPQLSLLDSHLVYNWAKHALDSGTKVMDLIQASFGECEPISVALQKFIQLSAWNESEAWVCQPDLDSDIEPEQDTETESDQSSSDEADISNQFSVLSL